MARLIPKGCSIHRIELSSKGAEIGFRCGSEAEDQAMVAHGYKARDATYQTYPTRFLKGVRGVSLGGAHVSGHGSFIGFNLPGPSNCKVERHGPRRAVVCRAKSGTASGFDGHRRRRSR